jgi:hypothetical protein
VNAPLKLHIGQRFGRWTITGTAVSKNGNRHWPVACDCGANGLVAATYLVKGESTSCGCAQREYSRRHASTLNLTHGKSNTPTFKSWKSMLDRCTRPTDRYYWIYGGAGITVCTRWLSFQNFLEDMGERPPGKTLDRWPDNNGNYEPGNCRWATPKEQSRNKRTNIQVTANGQTKCVAEWCDELGIPRGRVYERIGGGWSPLQALGLEPRSSDQARGRLL